MDLEIYLRFLVALVAVLALIGALAWAARRFGLGGVLAASRGATPRLSIVEVKVVDSRHKLVLLRRDSCEHLVLLGPTQDLLVERGLPAAADQAGARNGPAAPAGSDAP